MIEGIGIGTGEPMATGPQQPVAGFGIALQAPGLHQVVQPEQGGQVDLAWGVLPGRQTPLPAGQPGFAQHLAAHLLQPGHDRGHQLRCLGEQLHRLQMQLQILRPRRTHADGVNARSAEAKEIVEHDRMQRRAQLTQQR